MIYQIEYISEGKIKKTLIRASSFSDAIRKFRDKKLGVFKDINEYKAPSIKERFLKSIDLSKVDLEEFISILEQMYVMLNAGIGIDIVIENMYKQIKNKKLKKIFLNIKNDIQSGLSLSESFKKFEKELGYLTTAMIKLGEETGDIALAIKDLATILSEILDNRKRLKKATRYPTFIIFAMMVSFTIVILFVIPPFKAIFEQMQTELPLPTRFLLWIDSALSHYGLFIISGAISIFILISILYNKNPKARLFLDKMLLKIYIVGAVIRLAMIGRFVYVFQRLVDSGIPILDSIDIALNIVDNEYIKERLSLIKSSVASGGTIKEGFEKSELFENMIIEMISAGEESGALVGMLKKVSNYYLEKYKSIVDNLSVLIEPLLIMAIAGFILTMALGIFLPMWDLTNAVK